MTRACPDCLTRARLLEALAGRIEKLAGRAGRPVRKLLDLPDADLLHVAGVGEAHQAAMLDAARVAAAVDAGRTGDVGSVCIHDSHYPDRLRELPDPPRALFHTGPLDRLERLCAERPVAIVGSRRPSTHGQEAAFQLGRKLAAAQVTVVSGMAFGIDAACHRGALDGGGAAIAVLASGADRASPVGNRALYRELRAGGTVISEMPWGASPWRWLFPARNRIMAAISELTVVVEATERSGSLITAEFAESLGRTVAAMPGATGARLTEGNNQLIKDGCAVVRYVDDVLDLVHGVGMSPSRDPAAMRRPIEGDAVLGNLLDAVEVGETLDQLAQRTGLGPRELRGALARLEGTGLIRRAGLNRYVATTIG
jgi:DNA processing protein